MGEWMVAQMVTPSEVRLLTSVMTSLDVKLSRPEVGSSRNSTRGLVISAMPAGRVAWVRWVWGRVRAGRMMQVKRSGRDCAEWPKVEWACCGVLWCGFARVKGREGQVQREALGRRAGHCARLTDVCALGLSAADALGHGVADLDVAAALCTKKEKRSERRERTGER